MAGEGRRLNKWKTEPYSEGMRSACEEGGCIWGVAGTHYGAPESRFRACRGGLCLPCFALLRVVIHKEEKL